MAFFCIASALLLSACSKQSMNTDILCNNAPYNNYHKIVQACLPSYTVKTTNKSPVLNGVNYGTAIEAFDTFALSMCDTGQADYWYPQCLSTAVIAIDRDQTEAVINGWADLPEIGLPVGFDGSPDFWLLYAAAAYGMEGNEYSLQAVVRLLAPVHKQGNLKVNDFDAPVIICFDNQAAAMIQDGRNLEIIIPAEGTLSFARGLLSNTPLTIPDNRDALIDGGFRLLDGTCDERIYPASKDYERAIVLDDYTHLNHEGQNVTAVYRRDILGIRLYTSADGQEHQLIALLYMAVVIIWIGFIVHRVMQKGVRRTAVITSVLLVCWTLSRILKYQLVDAGILARYLWYSFYIFELGIPLVLIWLSSAIDKPENEIKPPKWWVYFAAISTALVLMVMTNDLHQLVFRMDFAGSDWSRNYSYGPLYYVVLIAIFAQIAMSQFMMLKKSRKGPQKLSFLFPLAFYLLIIGYCVGYALRVPILFDSDMTVISGIFTLLYLEVCVRIGIIPINRDYQKFFSRSPQKMQIINDNGDTILRSAQAGSLPKEIWSKLKANPHLPQQSGEDELLYADPVSGGIVVWHEDIRILGELSREIAESVEQIKAANVILEHSMTTGRNLTMSKARLSLFNELEKSIRRHLDELEEMLRHIPGKENRNEYLARVAVLVCYVKRKCHLFFLEQRTDTIKMSELAVYMDELSEFAAFAGFNCACTGKVSGKLPFRAATLIYDFHYMMFCRLYEQGAKSLFLELEEENTCIVLRTMQSNQIPLPVLAKNTLAEIEAAGGGVTTEASEELESLGFCVTFTQGGDSLD